jgi:hypothetical protein
MGTLGNIARNGDATTRAGFGEVADLMAAFWTFDNHIRYLLFDYLQLIH